MKQAFLIAAMIAVARSNPTFAADKPEWLAVTTEALASSIQPLAERRRSEGLDAIVVVGDAKTALEQHPHPAYLLIVGDAAAPGESPDPAWSEPAIEKTLYRWRDEQRKTFASDSQWGELDGDELPDVPVGRIPARTLGEAATVVAKILAYEDRPWTRDDLRFPLWEGAPNYGPAMDAVAGAMLLPIVQSGVPAWGEPSVIAGLPTSPFCGWPADHAATFDRWLRRGGQMAVFAGHGNDDSFFSMIHNNQWVGYQRADVERDFRAGPPTCPVVLITCLAGNFAGKERCLTESLVLAPGGPVAAMGATTESHPLTNALHGMAMARALAAAPSRLGDVWLAGLRGSHSERSPMFESVLANAEGSLEPKIDIDKLRRDQVWMYALMGDPATRLRVPGKLNAKIERDGDKWRWSAEAPPNAERLEVAFRAPLVAPAAVAQGAEPDAARAEQDKANSIFAYKSTSALPAGQAWDGLVDQPGDIRLLAVGANNWWVAVLKTGD